MRAFSSGDERRLLFIEMLGSLMALLVAECGFKVAGASDQGSSPCPLH